MSDYTPTIDQVRAAYVRGMRDTFVASASEHEAEFDRWVAAHDAEVRAGVVTEEPEWQYSYVERIGRYGDVHERVTFDSLGSAQRYLRANSDSITDWNREVKKRDRKIAMVEKRQMNIGPWVPVEQGGAGHEGHRILESPTVASLTTGIIPRTCTTCGVELEPRRETHA